MNCKADDPTISIVIPSRNEKGYIGACLDSILNQDYDKDKLDVMVVDGMSEDGTREVVSMYSNKYEFVKMLNNEEKITPKALNIGVKNARGEYVLILGSHSELGKGVLQIIEKKYREKEADCIGGLIETLPGDESIVAKAVALALAHPFGVGRSYFRIGIREERYVDTVPYGCYKKEVFNKIGMFDESLIRNQDDEFNLRLLNHSGKILLVPEIVSRYYARGSLSKLWKMFQQYGYFKPLVARKVGAKRTWRQMIPAVFVSGLLALSTLYIYDPSKWMYFAVYSGSYAVTNIFMSTQASMKRSWKLLPILPIVFSTLHLSYGIGYLKGVFDFLIMRKHTSGKMGDVPITR